MPAALQDFSELMSRYNVSQGLVDTVRECGYTEPTPVQRQAIPCMLEVSNYILFKKFSCSDRKDLIMLAIHVK